MNSTLNLTQLFKMGFTRDISLHIPSLHPSQWGTYLQRRRLSLSCHALLWGVCLYLLSPLPTGSGGCSCPHEAASRLQTQRRSHRSPCLQNWSCSPHQHRGVPDLTPIYPGLSWTRGPRWTTGVHHLLSFVPICPVNHSSPSHIIQPAYYLSVHVSKSQWPNLDVRTTASRALLQPRYMTLTTLPPSTHQSFIPRRPSGMIYLWQTYGDNSQSPFPSHAHDFPKDQARLPRLEFPLQLIFCVFGRRINIYFSLVTGNLPRPPWPPRGYRHLALQGHWPAISTLSCSPSCPIGPWVMLSPSIPPWCSSTAVFSSPWPMSPSTEVLQGWLGRTMAMAVFSSSAFLPAVILNHSTHSATTTYFLCQAFPAVSLAIVSLQHPKYKHQREDVRSADGCLCSPEVSFH